MLCLSVAWVQCEGIIRNRWSAPDWFRHSALDRIRGGSDMCLGYQVDMRRQTGSPKRASRLQAAHRVRVSVKGRIKLTKAVSPLLCAVCVLLLVACGSAPRLAMSSDDVVTVPGTGHRAISTATRSSTGWTLAPSWPPDFGVRHSRMLRLSRVKPATKLST